MSALLQAEDLMVGYGGAPVLRGVSLRVAARSITVIVGPNAAGKTTLLSALAGLLPCEGTIHLDGRDLAGQSVSARVARGLVLVPEGRHLFGEMSVHENLELGGYLHPSRERARRIAEVLPLFPVLAERRAQRAGTLSGGEQQMLALARALMADPQVLLLDEPSLGLAPRLTAQLYAIVRRIRDTGTAVLLVEQHVRQALALADHAYVLERGTVVAEGPGSALLASDHIHRAYLGVGLK